MNGLAYVVITVHPYPTQKGRGSRGVWPLCMLMKKLTEETPSVLEAAVVMDVVSWPIAVDDFRFSAFFGFSF